MRIRISLCLDKFLHVFHHESAWLDSFSSKYFRKCHYLRAQIGTSDAADRRRFSAGSSPVEQISSRASGNAPRVASYFSSHNFSWPFYLSRLHLFLSLSFSFAFASPSLLCRDASFLPLDTKRVRERSTSSVLFRCRVSLSFSFLFSLSCQDVLRSIRIPTVQEYEICQPPPRVIAFTLAHDRKFSRSVVETVTLP